MDHQQGQTGKMGYWPGGPNLSGPQMPQVDYMSIGFVNLINCKFFEARVILKYHNN